MLSYKSLLVFNKRLVFILLTLTASFNGECTVNVDKSRVIFSSGELTANISLHNSHKEPILVQLWTDAGDPLTTPDKVKTPVLVNPPVLKMQPNEVRNIRLLLVSTEDLPQNKESIFWLNILQIPPNTNQVSKEKNKLILPLRIRLKVFVRPKSVGDITSDDFDKILFSKVNSNTVIIKNPTKWYITIPSLRIADIKSKPIWLGPFSHISLHVKNEINEKESVTFDVIDDVGAIHRRVSVIN
ncbi:fimbria/pilus periplasmic chaperone [Enterobacter sp. KBR-315C3_2022]|uniref:fimbria/pilus periplasmic chaperone n=1 Tax=Enterobacter sp. KBR-315C3_2022 TaxID=3242494 RepID=UPI00352758DD